MAFGRKGNKESVETSSTTPAEKLNKSAAILAALKEGPKTPEELMEIIGAKAKTALFGQIAVLNTRAMNKYETRIEDGNLDAAEAAPDFPVKDGSVYVLSTHAAWIASKTASKPKKPAKTYTAEEMLANAQKRVEKTAKAKETAAAKMLANDGDAIYAAKATIAEMNHALALNLLAAVEAGDYKYEKGNVAE